MIGLLINFLKMLFLIKRKDRLPRVPRSFTTAYDKRVSRDVERVFHRSAARSPEGVNRLMRRKRVSSIDALLPLLADRQHKTPRQRFVMWVMRLNGTTPFEPTLSPALRRMGLKRGQTLIRRTQAKP